MKPVRASLPIMKGHDIWSQYMAWRGTEAVIKWHILWIMIEDCPIEAFTPTAIARFLALLILIQGHPSSILGPQTGSHGWGPFVVTLNPLRQMPGQNLHFLPHVCLDIICKWAACFHVPKWAEWNNLQLFSSCAILQRGHCNIATLLVTILCRQFDSVVSILDHTPSNERIGGA